MLGEPKFVTDRDVHPGGGVGQHTLAHSHFPVVGADQTREDMQCRRLACPVRAQHGQHFARGDVEFEIHATTFDNRSQRNAGHRRLPAIGAPQPATTQSDNDDSGHAPCDALRLARLVRTTYVSGN